MAIALAHLPATQPIGDLWRGVLDHVKEEYLSQVQRFPWIIGFSGGKDSTLVVHAIFEMLLEISPSQRSRPIHIVSFHSLSQLF